MIARMGRTRFIICVALILAVCVTAVVVAIGLNLPEASGKAVKKDGKMYISFFPLSTNTLPFVQAQTGQQMH